MLSFSFKNLQTFMMTILLGTTFAQGEETEFGSEKREKGRSSATVHRKDADSFENGAPNQTKKLHQDSQSKAEKSFGDDRFFVITSHNPRDLFTGNGPAPQDLTFLTYPEALSHRKKILEFNRDLLLEKGTSNLCLEVPAMLSSIKETAKIFKEFKRMHEKHQNNLIHAPVLAIIYDHKEQPGTMWGYLPSFYVNLPATYTGELVLPY